MDRLRGWLADGSSTLEMAVAAGAGFLAGQLFEADWPLARQILSLLLGG